MTKRKKGYVKEGLKTQTTGLVGMHLTYTLAGGMPSNSNAAGMLRSMGPVHGMVGMAANVQVGKGLLSELESLGKTKKKKRRKKL